MWPANTNYLPLITPSSLDMYTEAPRSKDSGSCEQMAIRKCPNSSLVGPSGACGSFWVGVSGLGVLLEDYIDTIDRWIDRYVAQYEVLSTNIMTDTRSTGVLTNVSADTSTDTRAFIDQSSVAQCIKRYIDRYKPMHSVKVKYRWSIGAVSVKCRWSIGQVSVKYR